jgi:hypothetical protein
MTTILILACLAIAGAELYMARGARRVADRLERLEAIALLQDERIESIAGGPVPVKGASPDRNGTGGGASADGGLDRLTAESALLRARLDTLEEAGRAHRDVHSRVTGAVRSLEQVVSDVLRHTVTRLDQEVERTFGGPSPNGDGRCDTVRGVVSGAAPEEREPLTRVYEECAAAAGLRIRFRVPGPADPWHARYYLAGRAPRELERDFLGMVESIRTEAAPGHDAGLRGLLRALDLMTAGFAQIGPLVAARAPGTLLCGVLTLAECRDFCGDDLAGDPAAVARRLRELPAERMCDVTVAAWAPAEPDLDAAPEGAPAPPSRAVVRTSRRDAAG